MLCSRTETRAATTQLFRRHCWPRSSELAEPIFSPSHVPLPRAMFPADPVWSSPDEHLNVLLVDCVYCLAFQLHLHTFFSDWAFWFQQNQPLYSVLQDNSRLDSHAFSKSIYLTSSLSSLVAISKLCGLCLILLILNNGNGSKGISTKTWKSLSLFPPGPLI